MLLWQRNTRLSLSKSRKPTYTQEVAALLAESLGLWNCIILWESFKVTLKHFSREGKLYKWHLRCNCWSNVVYVPDLLPSNSFARVDCIVVDQDHHHLEANTGNWLCFRQAWSAWKSSCLKPTPQAWYQNQQRSSQECPHVECILWVYLWTNTSGKDLAPMPPSLQIINTSYMTTGRWW